MTAEMWHAVYFSSTVLNIQRQRTYDVIHVVSHVDFDCRQYWLEGPEAMAHSMRLLKTCHRCRVSSNSRTFASNSGILNGF